MHLQAKKSGSVIGAIAAFVSLLLASATAMAQGAPELHRRWYVRATAPVGGDGESWPTAFRDLQEALAASMVNPAPDELPPQRNEIWVAAGSYAPTAQVGGLVFDVREPTFLMQARLAIFGGFAGGENELAERDPDTYVTILTGELTVPDIGCPDPTCFLEEGPCSNCADCRDLVCLGGEGLAAFPQCCALGWSDLCQQVAHDRCSFLYNSYHVITYSHGADEFTSQLDGFTIKRGRAEGNDGWFTQDIETFLGGGILIDGPLNVQANEAAKPVIARCTFVDNDADEGGGVYVKGNTDPHFLACSFISNMAREGAGFQVEPKMPPSNQDTPEATLVNCLLAGNMAAEHGGGIVSGGPALRLTNCTLAVNEAEMSGGGVWIELESTVTIHNSILWNNIRAIDTPDQITVDDGEAIVSYSDVEGGWSGTGNIDEDPYFVDPLLDPTANFRLQDISPAIDIGDPNEMAILPDSFDIDHDGLDDEERTPDLDMRDRIRNGPDGENDVVVDMGAYEFYCPWDCDGSNDGNVNVSDLLALLGQYDPLAPTVCDGGESCDYDGNGCVDVTDVLELLAHYTVDPEGVGCPGGSGFAQQGLQAIIESDSLELSESWIEILNQTIEAEAAEEQ